MLEITIVADKALAGLSDLERNQLPFAISLALNRTAQDVRAAQQAEITRVLVPKTDIARNWLRAQVVFPRFAWATKTKWEARVFVEPSPRSLVGLFAEGGTRAPTRGVATLGPRIAVPVRANFPGGVVPQGMWPFQLGLQQVRSISGNLVFATGSSVRYRKGAGIVHTSAQPPVKGNQRTFVVKRGDRAWIVQRIGKGKGRANTRVLYDLRTQQSIPRRDYFYAPADALARERLQVNLAAAMQQALATAR